MSKKKTTDLGEVGSQGAQKVYVQQNVTVKILWDGSELSKTSLTVQPSAVIEAKRLFQELVKLLGHSTEEL